MKIENQLPQPDPPGPARQEGIRSGDVADGRSRPVLAESDRVDVSERAALLNAAIKAAADAPEIRQDLVERMRQALADGTLGQDVDQLADRLIDQLLD